MFCAFITIINAEKNVNSPAAKTTATQF